MKNTPDIKVGIVVGSTDWLPTEVAIENRKRLIASYIDKYGEDHIYECPVCLTDNEVSIKRALKDVSKAECEAICLYYANYGPESAGSLFVDEFSGPIMMIAAAEEGEEPFLRERKDALSGFINACYAVSLRNTKVYIPSSPVGSFEKCADMISDFVDIAKSLIAIKNLKIVSFSPKPSSYLASYAPYHELFNLGVDVSEYSELELLNFYHKHEGDVRLEKIVAEMYEEIGFKGNSDSDIFSKFAQYEVTVGDWIRTHKGNRKYVAVTSTCWPAFPVNFGFVPCYVNSRLSRQGIPVSCEVDIFGALSEYIGQCVSDDFVTILNINNDIPKSVYERKIKGKYFGNRQYRQTDLFLGYHCGVTCSEKLCDKRMELHFVNNQLIGEGQSQGTIQGNLEPGPITIFRIQSSRNGKLKAYIAQGQILPVEMETYGGKGIIAIPEFDRFLRHVVIEEHFPNHTIVVFGHYARQLEEVLRQLGINEIAFNHPKELPYRSENYYFCNDEWY